MTLPLLMMSRRRRVYRECVFRRDDHVGITDHGFVVVLLIGSAYFLRDTRTSVTDDALCL
jgi:hypothetical protein